MVVEILAMALSLVALGVASALGAGAVRRSTTAENLAGRPHTNPAAPQPRYPPSAAPPGPPPGYASHAASRPPPYPPRPPSPPYGPTPPRSPRGLWVGATTTGAFGFVVLIVAVGSLLLSLSGGDQMLVTPPTAGGLERHDDPTLRSLLEKQKEYMREAGLPHPTVAFYREPGSTSTGVAFAGGWGRIPSPGGNLRGLLRSMGGPFGAGPRPRSYPSGPMEGEVICLSGASIENDSLPICGWADRSTIGVVMARGKTVSECADILLRMRPDMEKERV